MRTTLGKLRMLVERLIREAADEGTLDTSRLTLSWRVLDGKRMIIDARLKQPDWLEKAMMDVHPERPAVEQTVDFNGTEAYLNRMDAYFHGKGYGGEVMLAVLKLLKGRGFQSARGYIEHDNAASQRMMKKLGAVESDRREHGSYWTIGLDRL
jgi:hypothetical protein